MPALGFVLTRHELRRLVELSPRALGSLHPPPGPDGSSGERSIGQSISRHSLRLFLSAYAISNAYENVAVGLLKRKGALALAKGLKSKTSLRLAGSITAYSILYRTLYRILVPEFSLQPSSALPAFLAGSLASLALIIEPAGTWRPTVLVYLITRALIAAWRATARLESFGGPVSEADSTGQSPEHSSKSLADAKKKAGELMRDGRWWFGPHVIFGLANAVLLRAFVFSPAAFPSAYSSFILSFSSSYLPKPSKASPSPRAVVDTLAQIATAGWPALIAQPTSLQNLRLSPQVASVVRSSQAGHSRLACAMLHPGTVSCTAVGARQLWRASVRAARFFAALAALAAAIGWRRTINSPQAALMRSILAMAQSSAFVSLSISTAWATICLFQRILPPTFLPRNRFLLQGFLAGMWVQLARGRVSDLSAYGLRLAIQCGWREAVLNGRVKSSKAGEVFALALALGTLMAVFETDRDALGSSVVLKGLDQVAGPLPGYEDGSKVGEGEEGPTWDTRGVVFSPNLL